MNTIQIKKRKKKLDIVLPDDFNLNAVRIIKEKLGDGKEITIDLQNSRFVNSKAIIFLHKMMYSEQPMQVKLKNPPRIFFESLNALGLHDVWKLDEIIEP